MSDYYGFHDGGASWYGYGQGGGDWWCPYGRGGVIGGSGDGVGGGDWWCPYGRGGGVLAGPGDGVGRGAGSSLSAVNHGYGYGYAYDYDYYEWLLSEESRREAFATRAPASAVIYPEVIRAAEAAASEVLLRVHPTEEDEERRQELISHLRKLFGSTFGCEVCAFGSVPLRTYLPDGDIDISVMTNASLEGTFITDVWNVLHEQNADPNFPLTRLQFMDAEVKLFKCIIGNFVVDISFNQTGGVSTLCFLEMVDRQIGQNHLFKRSILLIKAWCHHESDILGGHNGLLTTYALEILILYIFNIFHKSLHGPLEVLYKFLEYFGKFEWDKYCLTLNGPVDFSSPHNSTAINDEVLLRKEPLRGLLDRLLVLPDGSEAWDADFRRKLLNILDPLKRNNNLGRSVSKENFQRIKTTLSSGAQKLGQILMLSYELIPDEIYGFFGNTLMSNGIGERRDLRAGIMSQSLLDCENALRKDVSDLKISNMNEDENKSPNDSLEQSDKESQVKTNVHSTSDEDFPGDAVDHPWYKIWSTKSSVDSSKVSEAIIIAESYSRTSHSSFSPENRNRNMRQYGHGCAPEEDERLGRSILQNQLIFTSSARTNAMDVLSFCPVKESNWTGFQEESALLPFTTSYLLDLSGDMDLHFGFLRNVQYHLEFLFDKLQVLVKEASLAGILEEDSFRIPILQFSTNNDARPPEPVYRSRSTRSYDISCLYTTEDPMMHEASMLFSDVNASLLSDSAYYHVYGPYMNGGTKKTVGTGTYIPKLTVGYYREYNKGRKQKQRQPYRVNSSSNDIAVESSKAKIAKGGTVEDQASTDCRTQDIPISQPSKVRNSQQRPENGSRENPALPHHGGNGQGNLPVSNTCQSLPAASKGYDQIKAQQEENLLFGNFVLELNSSEFSQEFPPLPASKRPTEAIASLPANKRPVEVSPPLPAIEEPVEASPHLPASKRLVDASAAESRLEGLYQLRDDADFPPLQAGAR